MLLNSTGEMLASRGSFADAKNTLRAFSKESSVMGLLRFSQLKFQRVTLASRASTLNTDCAV
jgi:hypothetical protein